MAGGAELLKQRSTRTGLGLFAAMLGLVLLAVLLHACGLAAEDLGRPDVQLMVLGRGEFLAALFAALLGAMSITAEIRHGTIHSTFLVTPRRRRVVAAKVLVSILVGAGFGLLAGAVARAAGAAAIRGRGIAMLLERSDYASAKRTVTVLRTSRVAAASSSAAHAPQKRKPSGFSWPQRGALST